MYIRLTTGGHASCMYDFLFRAWTLNFALPKVRSQMFKDKSRFQAPCTKMCAQPVIFSLHESDNLTKGMEYPLRFRNVVH